ncbi:hypothetical protein AAFF_G00367760 [Aldrovandia affinis]|uniref:Uncharacterized protein n=1 Tax=Aldrovandia affinis TaxID=143900 RepID=A0AAD7R531_9TELE|nr:hypothetical protein AAFF_G00367760 [Aldrovandia affinis]
MKHGDTWVAFANLSPSEMSSCGDSNGALLHLLWPLVLSMPCSLQRSLNTEPLACLLPASEAGKNWGSATWMPSFLFDCRADWIVMALPMICRSFCCHSVINVTNYSIVLVV